MKKIIIFLGAIMVLSFVSCHSKEYKDSKKLLIKFEKAIDKAKDCDDLQEAFEDFEDIAEEIEDKEYDDSQMMSDEEEAELDKMVKGLEKKFEKKAKKLCDDDD